MAVLTDDGTVWPEDQPAAPPAPANPPADPYGGYWIPRILANMWRTAVSGATLPGDVATGQASMSDPATQARVGDMAATAMLLPGAAPAEAGALNEGLRRSNAVAPAIIAQQPAHVSRRDCDHVAGRRLAEGRVAADTGEPVRHVS